MNRFDYATYEKSDYYKKPLNFPELVLFLDHLLDYNGITVPKKYEDETLLEILMCILNRGKRLILSEAGKLALYGEKRKIEHDAAEHDDKKPRFTSCEELD